MPDHRHAEPQSRRPGYLEAVAYLYDRIDYERATGDRNHHQFRLERTAELFEKLGLGSYLHRPKVPLIHLAGTKGKGSTATMVSQILTAAGYRVGLYTSPHLTDLEERFRIDGVPCSQETLIELVELISPIVDEFDSSASPVSFFELTTAMAVLYFDRSDCDAIVMEVGLGGRLDSTNVCASTVAAVTSIGLDHQRVLGSTIVEIAGEKAGIIKAGVPVVSGVTQPAAAEVIRSACRRSESMIFEKGVAFETRDRRDVAIGSEFIYGASARELLPEAAAKELPLFLALDGAHQVHNASIAISIVRLLTSSAVSQTLSVSDQQIASGLRTVHCIGRLERFWLARTAGSAPIQLILDTAHNHDSIVALCDTVIRRVIEDGSVATAYEPSKLDRVEQFSRPIVVVFGTSRDKDAKSMAAEIAKIADQVVCTSYLTNSRAQSADRLVDAFDKLATGRDTGLTVRCIPDPQLALDDAIQAASSGGTVIVCGSFFLAGELRPRLLSLPNLRRSGGEFTTAANTTHHVQ